MAILITGGAGYIGSHMVLALLEVGENVLVLDDLSTGFRWAIPAEVQFVKGSVGDSELVGSLLRNNDIEAVIYFAGSVIVPGIRRAAAPLLLEQHLQLTIADRLCDPGQGSVLHLLLHRGSLRNVRERQGRERRTP